MSSGPRVIFASVRERLSPRTNVAEQAENPELRQSRSRHRTADGVVLTVTEVAVAQHLQHLGLAPLPPTASHIEETHEWKCCPDHEEPSSMTSVGRTQRRGSPHSCSEDRQETLLRLAHQVTPCPKSSSAAKESV